MYATNFRFLDKSLSDFGMIIAEVDKQQEVTIGGVTFSSDTIPNKDEQQFYGAKYDSNLTWSFDIIKFDFDKGLQYISASEDAAIRRWLVRKDGYHYINFDQDEFRDIFYNVRINLQPIQKFGRTIGYSLSVEADTDYGYSQEFEYEFDLDSTTTYTHYCISDEIGYVYPVFEITFKETVDINGINTTFILENLEDTTNVTEIYSYPQNNLSTYNASSSPIVTGNTIVLDSENEIPKNADPYKTFDPNLFNWVFPRLVQKDFDTRNEFKSNISCHVKMRTRYPRKAVI